MGSFAGHAIPGSIFFVLGIWWLLQTYRRYFKTRKSGETFRCTPTMKCDCLCGRAKDYEVEGIVKVVFITIGIIGEVIHLTDCENLCLGNTHHIVMFLAFGLTGLIDLLVHHKVPLPDGIQYVSLILALIVEAFLFKFHLHGRSEMDVLLHTILVYAICLFILAIVMEMFLRNQPLCTLARSFASLLQGTWFWQVGFVLYPPYASKTTWDEHDPEQMMLITLMFACHLIGIAFVILIVGLIIGRIYRDRENRDIGYNPVELEYLIEAEEGEPDCRLLPMEQLKEKSNP